MGDNEKNVGLFEAAYYIVSDFLATEYGAVKHSTKLLVPTCLDDYVKYIYREEYKLEIEKPSLFLTDPFTLSIDGAELQWGMLSYSPGKSNIIGSIFNLPYEAGLGMELSCGMILSPYLLSIVHGDDSYNVAFRSLRFTYRDFIDEFNDLSPDSAWRGIFNKSPEVYNILGQLTNIVHDLLVKNIDEI